MYYYLLNIALATVKDEKTNPFLEFLKKFGEEVKEFFIEIIDFFGMIKRNTFDVLVDKFGETGVLIAFFTVGIVVFMIIVTGVIRGKD